MTAETSNAPKSGVRRPHLTKRVLRGLWLMDRQRFSGTSLSRHDENLVALASQWVRRMTDWYEAQEVA